jgi:hypothetical protein
MLAEGMDDNNRPLSRRGLVVSDLHLFARRSRGMTCFESLRGELESVDVLVLNGDIFDFRWSVLPDHQATQAWLSDITSTRVSFSITPAQP